MNDSSWNTRDSSGASCWYFDPPSLSLSLSLSLSSPFPPFLSLPGSPLTTQDVRVLCRLPAASRPEKHDGCDEGCIVAVQQNQFLALAFHVRTLGVLLPHAACSYFFRLFFFVFYFLYFPFSARAVERFSMARAFCANGSPTPQVKVDWRNTPPFWWFSLYLQSSI